MEPRSFNGVENPIYVAQGPAPLIIDEVQRGGDDLVRAIKIVVDERRDRGQFILSGSAKFLTVPTLSESLAGRAGFVDLWPLSLAERTGAPADLARLELAQETGLRARDLALLGFLHSSHGTSSQGFHVYLATGLTEGDPDREPEEQDMQQRWVTRAEFKNMIRNGTITDDSTVAAYSLLMLHEESARNPS